MEFTHTEQQNKKKKFFFLSDNVLRDSWDNTKRYKNLRMRREREKARKVI